MSRPLLHALLNGCASVLLTCGWLAIKGRLGRGRGTGSGEPDPELHKRFMLGALAVSAVFLASYLEYHQRVGHVPFWGEGWRRTVYLIVLVPHVILAALMVPAIVWTVVAALRGRLERHRRVARWTLPVWLYVSVTGVAVYWMLYVWKPPG